MLGGGPSLFISKDYNRPKVIPADPKLLAPHFWRPQKGSVSREIGTIHGRVSV